MDFEIWRFPLYLHWGWKYAGTVVWTKNMFASNLCGDRDLIVLTFDSMGLNKVTWHYLWFKQCLKSVQVNLLQYVFPKEVLFCSEIFDWINLQTSNLQQKLISKAIAYSIIVFMGGSSCSGNFQIQPRG